LSADSVVRVAVAGAVGAGKSTLVARLQFSAGNFSQAGIGPSSNRIAISDLATLDSFAALVTSSAAADAAVLVVDPARGVDDSVRRDLAVVSLLRVRHVVVAVTKMDDIGFDRAPFDRVAAQFADLVARLGSAGVDPIAHTIVPVSAMSGDNVAERGSNLTWFDGPTLLASLAGVQPIDNSLFAGRFPVQVVIRPRTAEHPDYRGYAGRVEAGVFRTGDRVQALPSGWFSEVAGIDTASGPLAEAGVGRSVTLRLRDELDVPRGEILVADRDPRPAVVRGLEATVFWFATSSARAGSRFRLRHGTRDVLCVLEEVRSRFDPPSVAWAEATEIGSQEVGRLRFRLAEPLVVDTYADSRTSGAVLVVDEATGVTVAAGLVD
jgi:sulfate adenylyltransferase subunit 1